MEDDDLELEDQHPAERRIEQKQNDSAQRELAVVDAVPGLSKEQRVAVLAVAGKDGDFQAAAKTLGFVQEPEPEAEVPAGPTAEELKADGVALGNMAAAAAGGLGAPAVLGGADAIKSVYARAQEISNPAELLKLKPELMTAIAGAGLQFGSAEAIGGFEPL